MRRRGGRQRNELFVGVPAPVPAAYRPAAHVPDTRAVIEEITNAPDLAESKEAIVAKLREFRSKNGLESK